MINVDEGQDEGRGVRFKKANTGIDQSFDAAGGGHRDHDEGNSQCIVP